MGKGRRPRSTKNFGTRETPLYLYRTNQSVRGYYTIWVMGVKDTWREFKKCKSLYVKNASFQVLHAEKELAVKNQRPTNSGFLVFTEFECRSDFFPEQKEFTTELKYDRLSPDRGFYNTITGEDVSDKTYDEMILYNKKMFIK
jgi:hypothetical protein